MISISRSSSPILRDLLLTHECFHGAYFSLPAFRDATEKEWASLSSVEQEVWREFLLSRSYNIDDSYLVVNEFQSYLLQQERLVRSGIPDPYPVAHEGRLGPGRGAGEPVPRRAPLVVPFFIRCARRGPAIGGDPGRRRAVRPSAR